MLRLVLRHSQRVIISPFAMNASFGEEHYVSSGDDLGSVESESEEGASF